MYGRQTECAIAVMSRLAEVYDGGETRLNAAEIADSRGLPRPFVAKVLSVLSQVGLVTALRGPGGGCVLARDPKTIAIYDVFKLFERDDNDDACPFGGDRCGAGKPCAIHEKLVSVQKAFDDLLHETTFDEFRKAAAKKNRPTAAAKKRAAKDKQESNRSTRRGREPR